MSAFIDERRSDFGVELICKTLGVSPSAYYERRSGRRSARATRDERLLALIEATHAKNYCAYGYRKMWLALKRSGEQVPRCTVQRLMRAAGIQGAKRRGKPWRTTRADPGAHRSPDLVERDFSAIAPNQLWVACLRRPATRQAGWTIRLGNATPDAVRAVGLVSGTRAAEAVEDEWPAFGVIEVDQSLVEHAAALALDRDLRSPDSLHLAAALVLPGEDLAFATWDRRLHSAARAEGLRLLPEALE